MRATFQGSIVALVTPFRGGKVDEAKLRELVEWHVASGTDGIVPCGTTGESPTLSHDEHKRVVELVIETARGRVAVIAGTGSNSTSEAIDLTAHAKKAGATGALVVNPYYNKPTQEGLYRRRARDPGRAATAFAASGARLACLCCSEGAAAREAMPFAEALWAAGARAVYLTADPGSAPGTARRHGSCVLCVRWLRRRRRFERGDRSGRGLRLGPSPSIPDRLIPFPR